MRSKRLISAVFSASLTPGGSTDPTIAERLGLSEREAKIELAKLVKEGLARSNRGRYELTPKGRKAIKVVFAGGGFEVIHKGHLHTLERAKELGDVLVVSVARDSTIRKRKNREPVTGENERVKLVSALRKVDVAILGVEGDIYETLVKVGPDVVALGYDQYHSEKEIAKEAEGRGMKVKVVRLDSPYPNLKTTAILNEL